MDSEFQITSKFQLDSPNQLHICSYQLLPWAAWRSIARPCNSSTDRRLQLKAAAMIYSIQQDCSRALNRRSDSGAVEWLEHRGRCDRAAGEPSGESGTARPRGPDLEPILLIQKPLMTSMDLPPLPVSFEGIHFWLFSKDRRCRFYCEPRTPLSLSMATCV